MIKTKELAELAKLVRYYILRITTEAGSGHPTSSLSACDLAVALFFTKLRFDLKKPDFINNDRVIFSKGHVSPLIYSLYAACGALSEKDLLSYRKFGSGLEGHPTYRFKFAEAATGSLGQGLSIGVGMAINAKYLDKLPYITYVFLGDSEMAEGSVWEAVEIASFYKLGNLVAIVDVNRLGQSRETMIGWNVGKYEERFSSFGWKTYVVDGHNLEQIVNVLKKAGKGDMPCVIIAKTIKGRGVLSLENKEGWHGKALGAEDFEKAIGSLGEVNRMLRGKIKLPVASYQSLGKKFLLKTKDWRLKTNYKLGEEVATRKAFGEALAKLGDVNPSIVSLDGETSNSTFSEIFRNKFPGRYFEMFIAEQNMVGAAVGLSRRGKIPFVSTFAAFMTRAFDQIRMAAYSKANVKFVGSHSGVSIGEDGPSQMGLEDLAMFRSIFGSVVLCPADAVSCQRLVYEASKHEGIVYIRTARPATGVIYKSGEIFKIGGSKLLKFSKKDKLLIVACGVAVFEALKAYEILHKKGIEARIIDAYSIKPIDSENLKKNARETGGLVICVEDHYFEGGLGDAVLNVFASGAGVNIIKLAVGKMPMSGKGSELLEYEGISSESIVKKVLGLVG